MKRVREGDVFSPSAQTWNSFIDAAQAHKDGGHGLGGVPTTSSNGNIITVRNASDYDLPVFAPAITAELATGPVGDHSQFFTDRNNPTFNIVPVDLAQRPGTFVLLTEPILAGQCGKAMLYGIMSVRLIVADENHCCASGVYGSDRLISCYDGPTRILFKQGGTGEVWGVVSLNVDDDSIAVRNNSSSEIPTSAAVMIEGFENGCFNVNRPDKDSMLNIYSYNGPILAPGNIGWINLARPCRFKVAQGGALSPGMAVGTVADRYDVAKGKFGFVVLAVDGEFAWCRYNGLASVLKAVGEPTTSTINVEHVNSHGNPDGDTFVLDIIPDEQGGAS